MWANAFVAFKGEDQYQQSRVLSSGVHISQAFLVWEAVGVNLGSQEGILMYPLLAGPQKVHLLRLSCLGCLPTGEISASYWNPYVPRGSVQTNSNKGRTQRPHSATLSFLPYSLVWTLITPAVFTSPFPPGPLILFLLPPSYHKNL